MQPYFKMIRYGYSMFKSFKFNKQEEVRNCCPFTSAGSLLLATLPNILQNSFPLSPVWPLLLLFSVTPSCRTLCDPTGCNTPGFLVLHSFPELAQTPVHWVVTPSNYLILCHHLLFLPSIFPSITVFSNESVLHIRWSKYWSLSFSISPSNEYSGLISFRMDRFHPLAVQGTLKCLLQQ